MIFKLVVEPKKSPDGRKLTWARTVKTAFASYTSKDRGRVLARVQGVEKVGVKVFLDTHGLRSKSNIKKEFLRQLTRLTFFTCFGLVMLGTQDGLMTSGVMVSRKKV